MHNIINGKKIQGFKVKVSALSHLPLYIIFLKYLKSYCLYIYIYILFAHLLELTSNTFHAATNKKTKF